MTRLIVKRPPNVTHVTPRGITIDYYDSVGVDGRPQKRRYEIDGEVYPSVSSIVKVLGTPDGMIYAAAKLAREGLDYRQEWDEAAKRGTATHDLIVRMMATEDGAQLSSLKDEHRGYGQAAAAWLFDTDPELIEAEQFVASTLYGFAGRFDLLAKVVGVPTRIDFKTLSEWRFDTLKAGRRVKPPYPEAAAQLSGYEIAARESGYEAAEAWQIVRLGPDGTYRVTEVGFHPQRFLACLQVYNARKAITDELKATVEVEPYPVAA